MTEAIAAPGNCSSCPAEIARTLGELADQFVPKEEWFFRPPQEHAADGKFTADAIRIAVVHYGVMGSPQYSGYGVARPLRDRSLMRLLSVQSSIAEGYLLSPPDVKLMLSVAQKRRQQSKDFANLRARDQQRRRKVVEPFLEQVEVDLRAAEFEPELAELEPIAQVFADAPSPAHGRPVNENNILDRMHLLDQVPFLIAKQALENCPGPWVLYSRRWLYASPREVQVCPNGNRDKNYRQALEANPRTRSSDQ